MTVSNFQFRQKPIDPALRIIARFRVARLKRNTFLQGVFTCFGRENKTGVVRILIILQGSMFSHVIQKVSKTTFP